MLTQVLAPEDPPVREEPAGTILPQRFQLVGPEAQVGLCEVGRGCRRFAF